MPASQRNALLTALLSILSYVLPREKLPSEQLGMMSEAPPTSGCRYLEL